MLTDEPYQPTSCEGLLSCGGDLRSTFIQDTRIMPYQSSMLKTPKVRSASATVINKSPIIGASVFITSVSTSSPYDAIAITDMDGQDTQDNAYLIYPDRPVSEA